MVGSHRTQQPTTRIENPVTETQTDPWTNASEAGGGMVDLKELVGKVLLIQPKVYRQNVKTKFKDDADVVEADITVIAPKVEDCETFSDVWLLQGRLIGKTKGKVGNGMVLGKLITEETDKGNPAYDLEDASDAAKEAARAWYQAKVAPPF